MKRYDTFLIGHVIGVISFMIFCVITKTTPWHVEEKAKLEIRQEAVNNNCAKWIATTNGEVKFKWNKMNE